ncbi:Galactose mutarotase-like superfamily protein [Abeliophyllum distichum]|uniref:Aldose 1-epimerase n=1 Tax=Abeliophyllum distichum TaxID=126358 RepID=A0ABD1SGV0_9LAMI
MANVSVFFCFIILLFGISVNGVEEEVKIYELKKNNFSIKLTNFGARIISVILPDNRGKLGDVVLGYDTLDEYVNDVRYFGAVVGRVANRISNAQFTLNGTVYKLDANEKNNTLHGGVKGFSQVVWKVEDYDNSCQSPYITLSYHSFDGEEGFPGDLAVSVTYALLDSYNLSVAMKAEALNKATPVNLAQHSYWNLGGHDSGSILFDEIQLFASHITPVNKSIPTGAIVPVEGTPYDFLKSYIIGGRIMEIPGGYDINYVLDGPTEKKMKPVAVVHSWKSGRVMRLSSDAPAVQFYTVNYMNHVKGKQGYVYLPHAALCLETQGFPDAVNHPNFPSQIVTPGKTYSHNMLYTFTIV